MSGWHTQLRRSKQSSCACYGIIGKLLAQQEKDYERGFVDGMQKQMQSSVDKAVNRMAQPEQEPVAWADHGVVNWIADKQFKHTSLLYNHPPQRTWVGLTDEEMETTFLQCGGKWSGDFWKIEDADFHPFLRSIEAKLKEKNCA